MENTNKFIKISQIAIIICLFISVGLNIWLLTKENEYKVIEKEVVKVVIDTVHDSVPKLISEKLIETKRDTFMVIDTLPGDTMRIVAEVPITQKKYGDDSTYHAYVSGYKPNLDSINIFKKTVFVEKTITKTKKQRFVIGPNIGYGYDIQNKKTGFSIGFGVTYNMFGF